MRPFRTCCCVLLLAVCTALPAASQPALSDAAAISLLTVLPGDQAYNMFGHSAFRVRDPARDLDVVFNYGTFDFTDPFFLPRFAYGQLDYFLSTGTYARQPRHATPLLPSFALRLSL